MHTPPSNDIEIRGLSGALGAEILGMDLSRPLSGAETELLLNSFYRYGVLCIRDVGSTFGTYLNDKRLSEPKRASTSARTSKGVG